MNRAAVTLIGLIVLMGSTIWMLNRSDARRGNEGSLNSEPVVVYCAASNRAVIESIRQAYQKECGRTVVVQYGPSQTLLSNIEVSRSGDLYLPADDSFIEMGRAKALLAEVIPIATMKAVLAVPRGNPKGIKSVDDLLKEGIKFVQANPDATGIGKIVRDSLSADGRWDKLQKAAAGERLTVIDIATDVKLGAADAGIVYDAVLHSYPELEGIPLPELESAVSKVSIGVIDSTKQSAAALHFARYVSAVDRGLKQYAEHGFTVERGDRWEDVPELSIFAGSMLRPAIEDTLVEFEKREGVRVSRVYNGCGILVAQMKAGQHPDAYFACDNEFMSQVPDIFPEPVAVSQNELVIMVQKGNPHGIRSLNDLSRKGLRVGIGHEKQCAMGWLTQNTFREAGIQQEVMENVKVQTPSGDMLVNQMQTGSLDVAVAYLSNAAGAADFLDAVRIEGLPCSIATQPFAIAVDSPHAQTSTRLFHRLLSQESHDTFLAEGFRWQYKPPKKDENDR